MPTYSKTRTWDTSTPDSGDLFDDEFDNIYSGMNELLAKTVTITWDAASGTAGGSSTSGSWREYAGDSSATMTLNDANGWGFCSISGGDFTLTPGKYLVSAMAMMYRGDQRQIKIYNVTASADSIIGVNSYASSSSNGEVSAAVHCEGLISIGAATAFDLRYRVAASIATAGLGNALSWGTERYAQIKITKVQ